MKLGTYIGSNCSRFLQALESEQHGARVIMLSSHERWRGRAGGCLKRVREGNVDAAGVGGCAGKDGKQQCSGCYMLV